MDGTGERGGKELTISAAADAASRGVVHLGASASFGTSGGGDFGGWVGGGIFWVDRKRDGDDDEMTRRGGRLRLLGSGAETAVWAVNGGPVNALTVEPIKLVDREKKRPSFIRLCLENMADSPLIEKRGLFFFETSLPFTLPTNRSIFVS